MEPASKSRYWRLSLEIVGLLAVIVLLSLLLKGFAPLAPALGSVLRALLNPFVLVGVVACVLLFRAGRSSDSG